MWIHRPVQSVSSAAAKVRRYKMAAAKILQFMADSGVRGERHDGNGGGVGFSGVLRISQSKKIIYS